jgi:malic enzyme
MTRRAKERDRDQSPHHNSDKSKSALLIAASMIAAVRLHKEEIKSSPKVHAGIADSIALAEMILKRLGR